MKRFYWNALATVVFLACCAMLIGAAIHRDDAGVAASGVCALLARQSMREPR